jgi:hypothetical protein
MSMEKLLVAPVILHVFFLAALGIRTALARRAAVISGRARLKDIALDSQKYPVDVLKLGRNFDNQFQVPLLWYAGVAFILIFSLADGASVALSWLFLALRLVHSYIHTGGNNVISRFGVFLAGFAAAFLIWAWLALRLFVIG